VPRRKLPISWDEKRRLWLKCLNCGHKWYPDARKWKDKNSNSEDKVVRCPKCHSRNRLPPAIVRFLKKQAKREPEFGFEPPRKEER